MANGIYMQRINNGQMLPVALPVGNVGSSSSIQATKDKFAAIHAANDAKRAARSSPASSTSGLLQALAKASGPTSTNKQTTTTNQNASPQLEQMMQGFQNDLQTLNTNTQGAYDAKQQSFNDVIRELSNTFRAREGAAAAGARQGAMATGLTPIEANSLGQDASMQVLNQFFPLLAGMRADQAGVGVDLQSALANLQGQLNLPFMQNIASPYYQNVAGQIQNTTGETTDTLGRQNLIGQLLSNMSSQNLDAQRIAESARQFDISSNLQNSQFGSKLMADLNAMLSGQQFQTGERIGQQDFLAGQQINNQTFQTSERVAGQDYRTTERTALQEYEKSLAQMMGQMRLDQEDKRIKETYSEVDQFIDTYLDAMLKGV